MVHHATPEEVHQRDASEAGQRGEYLRGEVVDPEGLEAQCRHPHVQRRVFVEVRPFGDGRVVEDEPVAGAQDLPRKQRVARFVAAQRTFPQLHEEHREGEGQEDRHLRARAVGVFPEALHAPALPSVSVVLRPKTQNSLSR
jgi:hypothetical protein